jgi:hypothetical protein
MGVGLLLGCSSDETGKGSQVGQSMAGSGGNGGAAGSLMLFGDSGGGVGGGGTGGNGGATAGSAGTANSGGASHGGSAGSGTGGSKPAGTCKRVPSDDADCTDFVEMPSQAWGCDDRSAYVTLNGMKGNKCTSGQLVSGAAVGACCPP